MGAFMAIYKTKTSKREVRYRVQLWIKGQRASKSFDNHLAAAVWQDETEKLLRSGESTKDRVAPGDMLLYEAMDRFIVESSGFQGPDKELRK